MLYRMQGRKPNVSENNKDRFNCYRRWLLVSISVLLIYPYRVFGTDWGATGLIRIPNGRVIEDTNLRLTVSQSYPYRHVAVTFGFLPCLELNARLVTLLDQKRQEPGWKHYGYYKDKVADFKVLLLKEGEYLPSVSFGVQDFHGTQLFFNEYVAMSKKFGNLDVTFGYGGNLLGSSFKEPRTKLRELDGIFGGVEWQVKDNLSVMLEYDPTKKLARFSQEKVKSPLNLGIKWKPWDWLDICYSFQRGYQHGAFFSIIWPFGQSVAKKSYEYPFVGPVDRTPLITSLLNYKITDRLSLIADYLKEEGFSDVEVTISESLKSLYVEYENRKYLSQIKALGRALRIIVCQCPSDVDVIHVIIKYQGQPLTEVIVNPDDFIDFLNGKISYEEILRRMEICNSISIYGRSSGFSDVTVGIKDAHKFSKEINPIAVENYVNDPSGFWKVRIGPTVDMKMDFGIGLSGEAFLRFPLWGDIDTKLPPISKEPIRSDIVEYLSGKGPVLEEMFVNKFSKIGDDNYFRLTAGILELQFAGVSTEYLKTFCEGKFGIGNEITWTRKRKPNSLIGFGDFETTTAFLKAYIFIPDINLLFQMDIGKFLGGDKGGKIQVTRFIRGGNVFLWYTKTDTSGFTGLNRGYSDKGVGFVLPVNIFKTYDCQGYYKYALSPWSRDVGQQVYQPWGLLDHILQFTPAYFKSRWNEVTD